METIKRDAAGFICDRVNLPINRVNRTADGTEAEAGPGEIVHINPGHDAWVVGDEPYVMVDFGASVGNYAKPS